MINYNPLNPPLLATPELSRVIRAMRMPGSIIYLRYDNRYKDGNIKIVNNILRGNSNTLTITRLEPPTSPKSNNRSKSG